MAAVLEQSHPAGVGSPSADLFMPTIQSVVQVLTDFDPSEIDALRDSNAPFWLDLVDPSEATLAALDNQLGLDRTIWASAAETEPGAVLGGPFLWSRGWPPTGRPGPARTAH